MQDNNKSGKIPLDTLSLFKALYKAIKSGSFRQQAEIHTKIYDSAIKDVENKMFEKTTEVFEKIDIIEKRFARTTILSTLIATSAICLTIVGSIGVPLYLHFSHSI